VEDDSDSPSDVKDNSETRKSKGKLKFWFLMIYHSLLSSLLPSQVAQFNSLKFQVYWNIISELFPTWQKVQCVRYRIQLVTAV
jgi:hypothetical protein